MKYGSSDAAVIRGDQFGASLFRHLRAEPASEAALCAGNQGKFWEMHDALFQNQATLADGDLADRARELGLDMARFSECVSGGKELQLIKRHRSTARDLSVQATPAFFIGIVQADGSVVLKKRINGALPFSDFRSAIMDVTPRELKDRVGAVALSVPGPVGDDSR